MQTLRRNPRLAWFPILSGIGAIGLLVVAGGLLALGSWVDAVGVAEPPSGQLRAAGVVGLVLGAFGHVWMIYSGVAMTDAALHALAGRGWTVTGSFRVARSRRRAIVTYALLSATVSHLLRGRTKRERKGRRRKRKPGMLRQLAGMAWSAATYLVLPVIAREGRGGLGAVERSASLLRTTWKEIAVARLTLWWVWLPGMLVGAAPLLLCAVLGVREPVILGLAAAWLSLGCLALGLLVRTLDGIYRAALYTYATEGVVPDTFAGDALDDIWEAAPGAPDTSHDDED